MGAPASSSATNQGASASTVWMRLAISAAPGGVTSNEVTASVTYGRELSASAAASPTPAIRIATPAVIFVCSSIPRISREPYRRPGHHFVLARRILLPASDVVWMEGREHDQASE